MAAADTKKEDIIDFTDAGSGSSIRSHIQELLKFLVVRQPDAPVADFEKLSQYTKNQRAAASKAGNAIHQPDDSVTLKQASWARKQAKVVLDGARETGDDLCKCKNLYQEMSLLNLAGCSLSEEECFEAVEACRILASQISNATMIRLWGKILALRGDYLIAEVSITGKGSALMGRKENGCEEMYLEPRGVGVNDRSYYVISSPSGGGWYGLALAGNWQELPNVRPEFIKADRTISNYLTGKLANGVNSYPAFPGTERELLRSRIARISHATHLVPTGFLVLDEETNEVSESPEFGLPGGPGECATAAAWVHAKPMILPRGTATYPENIPEEGDENDAPHFQELRTQLETQPVVPPLRSLEEELGGEEEEGAPKTSKGYIFKVHGDSLSQFKNRDGESDRFYSCVSVRSMDWPGATAVLSLAGNNSVANFYLGYAVKAGDAKKEKFYNIAPLDLDIEPPEAVEVPEPFPADEDVDAGEEEQEEGEAD